MLINQYDVIMYEIIKYKVVLIDKLKYHYYIISLNFVI